MGKNRDYTRYSKGSDETNKKDIHVVETDTVTNAIQMLDVEHESEVEVHIPEEPKLEKPQFVTGIVTDCVRLNVREDPDSTAAILGTITAATELIVNEVESTEDYYKVCTSIGLEGYCMKKFVTIMP